MMKRNLLIVFGIVLCGAASAQNYSNDVTFLSQTGNTLTVRSSGISAKKKEAPAMAVKSAFHTLFYTGVEGVNGGKPIIAEQKAGYDTRFFNENRYSIFVKQSQERGSPTKQGGGYKSTVDVTIMWDALQNDLTRNKVSTNLGMTVGTPDSQIKLPTVMVVPYNKEGEDVRTILDNNQMLSLAVSRVTSEFSKRGYKTKDFVSQLKLLKRNDILTDGTQSDAVSKMIQNMGADIIVTAKIFVTVHANRQSEVTLELKATELQTAGNLASADFLSGKYNTTDSIKLADYAFKKIQNDFFTRLQSSFNNIVENGREVMIQLVLARAVTEWDFEAALPNGKDFLPVMEDWLLANAVKGVYNMNHSNKVVDISIQIPVYDDDNSRTNTVSRFSTQLRDFMNGLFEGEYTVSIATMGQGLTVTIQ